MKSHKVLPSATEPQSLFKLLVSVWLLLFVLPTQPVPGREETWLVDNVFSLQSRVWTGAAYNNTFHFSLSGISFWFKWGRQDKHGDRSTAVLGPWEQTTAAPEKSTYLEADLASDCCLLSPLCITSWGKGAPLPIIFLQFSCKHFKVGASSDFVKVAEVLSRTSLWSSALLESFPFWGDACARPSHASWPLLHRIPSRHT